MSVAGAQVENARVVLAQQALVFQSFQAFNDLLFSTAVVEPDGALVLCVLGMICDFTCIGFVPAGELISRVLVA